MHSEEVAFKGMELYSWQSEAGEWQYSILVGTNRNKSLDEVQEAPLDFEEVKEAIEKMAIGESLFWMQIAFDQESDQMVNLPAPPENVILELQEFASEKQVTLCIP